MSEGGAKGKNFHYLQEELLAILTLWISSLETVTGEEIWIA